ncbi:hypothetical protein [Sulfuricella sp.]|uniref:hypothetical protein n=1 Tax=Sulfuricella sp. TaxID=2099377 RepID=UPI002C869A1A|nr:hypothetical protein [Sulfuricella sp.]HUX64673.1 hypothetical protein [Sulfuricella sp.]
MCELNWLLLLEYAKVLFSWPPIALVIALVILARFRLAIQGFLNRATEANVLGQTVKAAPPIELQREVKGSTEDRLTQAAKVQSTQVAGAATPEHATLPPELQNDPQAQLAITYVKNNPIQTVVEYKRLFLSYNYERLFNSVYGTQISLLEFLASRPTESITLPEVAPFHSAHQALVGRTEYQLRDYVNFLVAFGVLSAEGPPDILRYRITQHGAEFLSYIKANYPSVWNQRAL